MLSSTPYSHTPSAYVPPSMSATKFHTHTEQRAILQFYTVKFTDVNSMTVTAEHPSPNIYHAVFPEITLALPLCRLSSWSSSFLNILIRVKTGENLKKTRRGNTRNYGSVKNCDRYFSEYSGFPCQYHCTYSTYQFPASIIAPTVHTNSSIHDRRCINLATSGRH